MGDHLDMLHRRRLAASIAGLVGVLAVASACGSDQTAAPAPSVPPSSPPSSPSAGGTALLASASAAPRQVLDTLVADLCGGTTPSLKKPSEEDPKLVRSGLAFNGGCDDATSHVVSSFWIFDNTDALEQFAAQTTCNPNSQVLTLSGPTWFVLGGGLDVAGVAARVAADGGASAC